MSQDYSAFCGTRAAGRCTRCRRLACATDGGTTGRWSRWGSANSDFFDDGDERTPPEWWGKSGPAPGSTVGHWAAYVSAYCSDNTFCCRACRDAAGRQAADAYLRPQPPHDPVARIIFLLRHRSDYSLYEVNKAVEAVARVPHAGVVIAQGLAAGGVSPVTVELGKSFGRREITQGWVLNSHGGDIGGITYEMLLVDGSKVVGERSLPEPRSDTVYLPRFDRPKQFRVGWTEFKSILARAEFGPACASPADESETRTAVRVELDGFTFEAADVDWDAAEEAFAINEFNGVLAPGFRFIFVTVTATRTGSGPASLGAYELFAVATSDDGGVIPTRGYSTCVVTPDPWDRERVLESGDIEEGVFCFEIGDQPIGLGEMSIKVNHQIPGGDGVKAIVDESG